MISLAAIVAVWCVVTGAACFLRGEPGPSVPPPKPRRPYVWMP